jgi:putative oxidoreductase
VDKFIEKLAWFFKLYECKIKIISFLSPVVNLLVRLWLATIFLKSALLKVPAEMINLGKYEIFGLKIDLVSKGNWDSTLYLFTEEHPVPLLSAEVAAFIGTSFEVLCPLLLIIGLFSRFSAFILLAMTAFIQITYFQATDHLHWMLFAGIIVTYGADKLSLDYLVRKQFLSCHKYRKAAGLDK